MEHLKCYLLELHVALSYTRIGLHRVHVCFAFAEPL